jgi:hypothetical protein
MVLCSIIENTEGAIKNGQSRETDNIGYTLSMENVSQKCKLYLI